MIKDIDELVKHIKDNNYPIDSGYLYKVDHDVDRRLVYDYYIRFVHKDKFKPGSTIRGFLDSGRILISKDFGEWLNNSNYFTNKYMGTTMCVGMLNLEPILRNKKLNKI